MVSGLNGAMVFLFSKWCNGKIIIWCNGDMVKLSNGEFFFGTHFHRWRNGEMANKINSTMSCMVRFNCCVDYQIGFILLAGYGPKWI